MRPKLSNQAAVLLTRSVLALAAVTACASQGQAQDISPVTNRFFGAAAMAFGQTARVNIAHIDDPGQFPAGATCSVIINYFGADGTPLMSPFREKVGVGQSLFIDLNRNSLTSIRGNRVIFRAVGSSFEDPNEVPNPCADIRTIVEVYDNLTERTMVFIGDPTI
jgi:hypothetical protein